MQSQALKKRPAAGTVLPDAQEHHLQPEGVVDGRARAAGCAGGKCIENGLKGGGENRGGENVGRH